jgi:predicted dehydrogenase
MSSRGISRRELLACVGLAVPYLVPRSVLAAPGKPGANDRIQIGVIGSGNRSSLLVAQTPEPGRIVAICDVDLGRAALFLKKLKANWPVVQDYRKLLDRKDIDGLIVGTTDHGRVLPCIHACQAGKDVYAEKPLTLTIGEGRVLVRAVRKYGRVLQVGSQQRSMAINRVACEFVRNGGLGKVHTVLGVNYPGPNRFPGLPQEKTPEGLDWDKWCGQTELRPYNRRLQFGWMGWRDYSGGQMTNWGAHGLDQVQWALGADGSGPTEIWTEGTASPAPVMMRYASGVLVKLELPKGPMGGAIFIGDKGKIEINRNKYNSNPPEIIPNPPPQAEIDKWKDETGLWQAKYHIQNWLECMRTRARPVADVEIGHRSISVCHLGNIAREVGRKLKWDPAKEVFVGDEEANRLLERPRRKGYELPAV